MDTDVTSEVVRTRCTSSRGGRQRVVVARLQRALAEKPEPTATGLVELLVLIALVEADEPPGEMIVYWCHRPGWHDQAEQTERAVGGAKEKPLADTAAHPTVRRILLKPRRQPIWSGQQRLESRLDRRDTSRRVRRTFDRHEHAADEAADQGRVEYPLVVLEGLEGLLIENVAHRR